MSMHSDTTLLEMGLSDTNYASLMGLVLFGDGLGIYRVISLVYVEWLRAYVGD